MCRLTLPTFLLELNAQLKLGHAVAPGKPREPRACHVTLKAAPPSFYPGVFTSLPRRDPLWKQTTHAWAKLRRVCRIVLIMVATPHSEGAGPVIYRSLGWTNTLD